MAKKKNGRPTKWKPKYKTEAFIKEFVEYCEEKKELVSLCGLAVYIEVCEETIQEWKKSKKGFSASVKRIKQISKNQLLNGGLSGSYSAKVTCMALSANHGMHEKKETELTGDLRLLPPIINRPQNK